ncbi:MULTISPECIES: hypothetical protein [Ponticoccus]|uniref:Uncharacterized protein n=1 Tax=Ponticoccus litoralis TaxID=422297 RepID=A0AAW9SNH4_9RHOB
MTALPPIFGFKAMNRRQSARADRARRDILISRVSCLRFAAEADPEPAVRPARLNATGAEGAHARPAHRGAAAAAVPLFPRRDGRSLTGTRATARVSVDEAIRGMHAAFAIPINGRGGGRIGF